MLFYSFFKSLVGKDVVVELKNDLSICGTLHSVDQYLNIKLTDISVTDPEKYPHMLSVKNCFIRLVVRYVQLPADEVDTQLLQDAARKEACSRSSDFPPPAQHAPPRCRGAGWTSPARQLLLLDHGATGAPGCLGPWLLPLLAGSRS
ncbi:U6 snRNA-associated Sm-like protein LSm2 isoform X2 [Dermochelys coriacea]|uniref:U6 snRNA-associated Sm-like protein LSm2 isoform X2 n=1 Tax=Dermochelys coriacea TaxID=27794 RepID=UPI001CA99877|nr:U6 snRNA-associated Sm-like protein LSm2 isoform X2 [Dermochelys coriacea]